MRLDPVHGKRVLMLADFAAHVTSDWFVVHVHVFVMPVERSALGKFLPALATDPTTSMFNIFLLSTHL